MTKDKVHSLLYVLGIFGASSLVISDVTSRFDLAPWNFEKQIEWLRTIATVCVASYIVWELPRYALETAGTGPPAVENPFLHENAASPGWGAWLADWWHSLTLWWQDPGRPLAECWLESKAADGTALCMSNINGALIPFTAPMHALEQIGVTEAGERFTWKIPPDGHLRAKDLKVMKAPSALSAKDDRHLEELYRKHQGMKTEKLQMLLDSDARPDGPPQKSVTP